jgi:hypothetical protein
MTAEERRVRRKLRNLRKEAKRQWYCVSYPDIATKIDRLEQRLKELEQRLKEIVEDPK